MVPKRLLWFDTEGLRERQEFCRTSGRGVRCLLCVSLWCSLWCSLCGLRSVVVEDIRVEVDRRVLVWAQGPRVGWGMWDCGECGCADNYAFREECRGCKAPRPEEMLAQQADGQEQQQEPQQPGVDLGSCGVWSVWGPRRGGPRVMDP